MRTGTQRSHRSAPPADLLPRRVDRLTKREREVLLLLADGLTNQALASRLGIAQRTVRAHIFGIVRKLELHFRTEAALVGDRHRALLEPDMTLPEAAMP
ncbi:LuxR C-terminal-related transcriptional regulator [Streptomyces violaceusniger]|uniref:LuxR C-terminal-related transcriptional regulator n=1 Tax=Streptomyces violaceusniger TaxID=68280 RepID=UPI0010F47337